MAPPTYIAPHFLEQRGITDREYALWLDKQSEAIWRRERKAGKTAFPSRASLKAELHRVLLAGNGRDQYTGSKIYWKHLRADWVDGNAGVTNYRHLMTLRRCMPTFDHVRGMGHRRYALCRRMTNHAKSFMSPAQFVALCREVVRHHERGGHVGT